MAGYKVRIRAELYPTTDRDSVTQLVTRIVDCMNLLASSASAEPVGPLGVFDFHLHVDDAVSPLDAVLSGASTLRSAAHHAEVRTAGWPEANTWSAFLEERAVEASEVPDEDREADLLPA